MTKQPVCKETEEVRLCFVNKLPSCQQLIDNTSTCMYCTLEMYRMLDLRFADADADISFYRTADADISFY